MDDHRAPTFVIVPGLRGHVPEHWQTLLERRLANSIAVPRMADDAPEKLSCAAWVAALDRTLASVAGSVVLVAHSAGCAIVAHWARRHDRPIRGALLATPPDFETPLPDGYPTLETLARNGWAPLPTDRLPFPSIVAASTNDPLASFDRVADLASRWRSRLVNLGAVGHLNPAAGFGPWPRAEALLRELCGALDVVRDDPRPAEPGVSR
ncbi:MAG TPA: alpha/beta fold hydrolase [Casimicrobiaceae bacterium]|nr:alpha/beta fold hydrolase [Casimicrobiaceae bacterium]